MLVVTAMLAVVMAFMAAPSSRFALQSVGPLPVAGPAGYLLPVPLQAPHFTWSVLPSLGSYSATVPLPPHAPHVFGSGLPIMSSVVSVGMPIR